MTSNPTITTREFLIFMCMELGVDYQKVRRMQFDTSRIDVIGVTVYFDLYERAFDISISNGQPMKILEVKEVHDE